MHDTDAIVQLFLIFYYQVSQLIFPHSSLFVEVVQYFDVSVELQRSTLPFGLFDSQTRYIILELVVDEIQKKAFSLKLRKLGP